MRTLKDLFPPLDLHSFTAPACTRSFACSTGTRRLRMSYESLRFDGLRRRRRLLYIYRSRLYSCFIVWAGGTQTHVHVQDSWRRLASFYSKRSEQSAEARVSVAPTHVPARCGWLPGSGGDPAGGGCSERGDGGGVALAGARARRRLAHRPHQLPHRVRATGHQPTRCSWCSWSLSSAL